MSFSTQHEVDAELEWDEQRVEEALMILCGYFGTNIEALKQFDAFTPVREELESLARHGWVGGKRYAHTAPTIPNVRNPSGTQPAVELPKQRVPR